MEKTNLGVKTYEVLGGKISMGNLSPEIIREQNAFNQYKKDLEAAGEANPGNPDGAKKIRIAYIKYCETLDKREAKRIKNLFQSLNLEF